MRHIVSIPNLHTGLATASGNSPVVGAWKPLRLLDVGSDVDRKARLAYAIRRAREISGLTPPQLAERLGRARGTINDWESGKSAPSLLDLGPLCEVLGADPRLFADLPPEPVSPVDEYLVGRTVQEGLQEGLRRAGPREAASGASSKPQRRR